MEFPCVYIFNTTSPLCTLSYLQNTHEQISTQPFDSGLHGILSIFRNTLMHIIFTIPSVCRKLAVRQAMGAARQQSQTEELSARRTMNAGNIRFAFISNTYITKLGDAPLQQMTSTEGGGERNR